MLLSQKVGGEGISLIGASRLVVLEPDHNPAKDQQLCGRLWRPGQTAARVYTYRLLSAGTLEELIYQRQQAKMELGVSVDIGDNGDFDSLSHDRVGVLQPLQHGSTAARYRTARPHRTVHAHATHEQHANYDSPALDGAGGAHLL
jgi:superfamily II DNA or RNA helicase